MLKIKAIELAISETYTQNLLFIIFYCYFPIVIGMFVTAIYYCKNSKEPTKPTTKKRFQKIA